MTMRTTVNLTDDVAAAVAQVRRKRSIGMSQAINELIRAGLTANEGRARHFARSPKTSDPGWTSRTSARRSRRWTAHPALDRCCSTPTCCWMRSTAAPSNTSTWKPGYSSAQRATASGTAVAEHAGVSAHLHASACIRATADALNRVGSCARLAGRSSSVVPEPGPAYGKLLGALLDSQRGGESGARRGPRGSRHRARRDALLCRCRLCSLRWAALGESALLIAGR